MFEKTKNKRKRGWGWPILYIKKTSKHLEWFYKRGKHGCFVIAVARGFLDVAIVKTVKLAGILSHFRDHVFSRNGSQAMVAKVFCQ